MNVFLPNGCTRDDGHCWHSAGHGFTSTLRTNTNSGTEQMTCCHCGRPGQREWRDTSEPIDGHGPHVVAATRKYGPTLTRDQLPHFTTEPNAWTT